MIEFGFKSDTGKMREINQDSFFVMPEEGLFFVADGVGGSSFGELASRMTMADMASYLKENPIPEVVDDDDLKEHLLGIIIHANRHVHDTANERKAAEGMATTLIMLCIRGSNAYVINIGDSRAYLIRDEQIMQVTEDHTLVNDLVKRGVITKEQATVHPAKSMITRAIGAENSIKPDFYKFEIYSGDTLMLCTDGLYNEVPETDICDVLCRSASMRAACTELVDIANNNGGRDNITVVALRI